MRAKTKYGSPGRLKPLNTLQRSREDKAVRDLFSGVSSSRLRPSFGLSRQLNCINATIKDTTSSRSHTGDFRFPIPSPHIISIASSTPTQPSPRDDFYLKIPVNTLNIGSKLMSNAIIYVYETELEDEWELRKNTKQVAVFPGSALASISTTSQNEVRIKLKTSRTFKYNGLELQTNELSFITKELSSFEQACDAIEEKYPKIFTGPSRRSSGPGKQLPPHNVRLTSLQPSPGIGLRKRPPAEEPSNRVRRPRLELPPKEDVGEKISRLSLPRSNPTSISFKSRSLLSKSDNGPLIGAPTSSLGRSIAKPQQSKALTPNNPIIDAATGIRNSIQDGGLRTNIFPGRPTEIKSLRPPSPIPVVRGSNGPRKYDEKFNTPFRFIFNDNKSLDITPDDVTRLNEGEFLNDTLINFFLKYFHQVVSENDKTLGNSIYIFNTFFYEKLSLKRKDESVSNYSKVKTWTSKVDLFKMKYVIVPINYKMHWYLAIIYNLPALLRDKSEGSRPVEEVDSTVSNPLRPISKKDDCVIFVLDSLRSRNYIGLTKNMKDYIYEEAMDKLGIAIDKSRIVTKAVDTPQQNNLWDCGVYVIHYVHQFMSSPEKIVDLMIKSETDGNSELRRMWEPTKMVYKRSLLKRRLIAFRSENEKSQKERLLQQEAAQSQQEQTSSLEHTEAMQSPSIRETEPEPSRNNGDDTLNSAIHILDRNLDMDEEMQDVASPEDDDDLNVNIAGTVENGSATKVSNDTYHDGHDSDSNHDSRGLIDAASRKSQSPLRKEPQIDTPKSPIHPTATPGTPMVVVNDDESDEDGIEVTKMEETQKKSNRVRKIRRGAS